MKATVPQVIAGIKRCMVHKLVPMIHGNSGVGKSDIVHQIAKLGKLKLIDWRGSTAEPQDLSGFPVLSEEKATYLPFDTFPVENDLIPKGYNGWVIFADELNGASASVQKAMYKLILDRMVGNHNLHDKVYIIAAGNLANEGALVNSLPTPLQSRMVHFELTVDAKAWNEWATDNKLDYRVISFIGYKPHLLHNFKLGSNDYTFACPRRICAI